MSPDNRQTFTCVTRAAVGAAVFCAVAAAHAQIDRARALLSHRVSSRSRLSRAMRTVTPAVIAPSTRPIAAVPNTLAPNAGAADCLQCAGRIHAILIVRCCELRAGLRAASRSPSSPSVHRRRPVPARVRRPRVIRAGLPSNSRSACRRQDITVLNRGVNGEETDNMMARFASGVIAAHPQLVLWQVGTNSVLRDRPSRRIRRNCTKASTNSRRPAPTWC